MPNIITLLKRSAEADLRAARHAYDQTHDPAWLVMANRCARAIETYDRELARG